MDEPLGELVRAWLSKAEHDLELAELALLGPERLYDVAIFHCQQGAEKAVKAFLTFQRQDFEKTHNLRALMVAAMVTDMRFTNWLTEADRLTPYATQFRYPGAESEPTAWEFRQAYQAARAILRFVLSLLPGEVHPD